MSSCGNPIADDGVLMPRRLKFDKGRHCVKCKLNLGNIVIRHAVYCRDCFTSSVTIKFKRGLEPHVNANAGTSKRPKLKASGSLVIGFSGGLGSSVLLDLVYKTYFSSRSLIYENGEPRGGTKHPRNASVWTSFAVCYVEVANAFPGEHDRTEEIRKALVQYVNAEFIPLRLEDAFDESWWRSVAGTNDRSSLALELGKEGLLTEDLRLVPPSGDASPTAALRAFLAALPTPTAISRAIHILIRLLLLYTARSRDASHLLLGASLTTLSVSLISCVAQGGGYSILEELQEEWVPPQATYSSVNSSIRVVRPLRDVTMKECTAFAWWNGIYVPGRPKTTRATAGILNLTKDFIVGLEKDYPSTVSTIARTCSKLEPKSTSLRECRLCCRPLQEGLADWKAQISMRSLSDTMLVSNLTPASTCTSETYASSPSLVAYLCYSCLTMLTSRSSRKTGSSSTSEHLQRAPLPVWSRGTETLPQTMSFTGENGELLIQKRQTEVENRDSIIGFLLPSS
ncbi:hypothetical protein V8B97DRAFT_2090543 [Scleroderma yunnanense]